MFPRVKLDLFAYNDSLFYWYIYASLSLNENISYWQSTQNRYHPLPLPRTYFNKQSMQSTAAFANTRILSVFRKTSNTSSTAATCRWRASFTSSFVVYSILTARNAPNNGRQPDLISDAQASTNSHIEHTTCKNTSKHETTWKIWTYPQFSNISCTQSHNINVSRLALLLSLPSPLKPCVKLRMKM